MPFAQGWEEYPTEHGTHPLQNLDSDADEFTSDSSDSDDSSTDPDDASSMTRCR